MEEEAEMLYTFNLIGEATPGDLVICHCRNGARLGRIAEIVDFSPRCVSANCEKINENNRNALSAFNNALAYVAEGMSPEWALEKAFNGYTDCRAADAFAYKYCEECTMTAWRPDWMGNRCLVLFKDDDEGGVHSYKEICFG